MADQDSKEKETNGKLDTRKPGPWNGSPGPGRPKGVPNKLTMQQREVAEMVLGKPGTPEFEAFIAQQRRELLAGILPPPIVQLWLHYMLGKPKETIDLKAELLLGKVVREVVSEDVKQIAPPAEDLEEEHPDAVH